MSSQPPAGIGTAYFPEPDVSPNGGRARPPGLPAAPLRALPRRRRPAVIALAVAMAGAGVLVSATLYQRADHQVPVVMVTARVPVGAVVTSADLTTARVLVPAGIHVIPARQLGQVSGETAAAALQPGTLLAPSDLTSAQPPGPGQQLVPVALKPSVLPATGLSAGDHVLIVPTPGDQGQAGTSASAPALTAPVPAVVAGVSNTAGSDGLDVVDLLVRSSAGPAVAAQASTGQFALIVTKRDG
ncbi:MAG TPA: SAF domain-containing protein [Streptosporangiaceae bacterium]|jgi:hypothetical protein